MKECAKARKGDEYLSISSDSKQSLLPADKLHRPQCGEGFSGSGHFDLCPLNAPQLTSVVVAPAVDGATPACREGPVIWSPVHPLHKLLVMLTLEQVVALVETVHALVIGHELANFLCNLQRDRSDLEGKGLRTFSGQSVMKKKCRLAQTAQPGTLTSSRKGLGREVLLSRATATLEAVQ